MPVTGLTETSYKCVTWSAMSRVVVLRVIFSCIVFIGIAVHVLLLTRFLAGTKIPTDNNLIFFGD